jgi:benzil reductase ((S)-benzoin forming)
VSQCLVFVSGASSGIGQALVRTVPSAARVIGISRRVASDCVHVEADLTAPAGWRTAATAFEREIAGFSGERVVFIHAAGTLDPMGFAGEVEAEAYARQVVLNSAAPQILGDAFLRALSGSSARGQLLMISSGAAHTVYPGWTAYGAGKAAVEQWVRVAADEQTRRGDRCAVIAVSPGIVETPMQEVIRASSPRDFPEVESFAELHRTGALRDPMDAAREIWSVLDSDPPGGTVIDLYRG